MGKGGFGVIGGGGGGGGTISPGVGSGSAGTCFSGGSGSGGSFKPLNTSAIADAGIRGGIGTQGVINGVVPTPWYGVSGAGNPSDITGLSIPPEEQALHEGTGGVLIIFVEGNINLFGDPTTKFFTANGAPGYQAATEGNYPGIYPFGGGSGGGIVILVNKNATSLTANVEAKGGIVRQNGPSVNFRSGGDGAAVCYTFNQV
jgi:hypothetical protein